MFKRVKNKVVYRVTLAFFLCVFLPILIFIVVIFWRIGDMTNEQNLENINNSLITFEQAVWKEIYDYDPAINTLISSKEIINYINNPNDEKTTDEVGNIITDYTSENGLELSNLSFYTYNDYDYSIGCFKYVDKVKNDDWYRKFFIDSVDDKWYSVNQDNKYMLIKLIKIHDNRNEEIGVLRIEFNLKHLIYTVSHSLENNNIFFATDIDGQDIYFDENTRLFKDREKAPRVFSSVISKLHQGNKGVVTLDNSLAVVKIFSELDIIIGCGIESSAVSRGHTTIITSLVFTIIILIIFAIIFYYYLYKIFATLKHDLATVDDLVENNPSGRLAIKYDDEIGDIERQYNNLLDKIEKLTKNIVLKERLRKSSEIAMLQSQLTPHFIYNVINHFRMRAEINEDYDMADSIAKFGKLMRYNMMNRDFVTTLKEELISLRYYLDLESMRFSNQMEFSIECESGIDDAKVPKCLFQPIVENSIKYGKGPDKVLKIDISIKLRDNKILISIRDNGKGTDEKTVQSLNSQFQSGYYIVGVPTDVSTKIGLKNINHRIRLIYDDSYHLKISSKESEYFEVSIEIPFER